LLFHYLIITDETRANVYKTQQTEKLKSFYNESREEFRNNTLFYDVLHLKGARLLCISDGNDKHFCHTHVHSRYYYFAIVFKSRLLARESLKLIHDFDMTELRSCVSKNYAFHVVSIKT